ncbi:MAG: DUF362 domain-containing protein [Candidatus Omnitrophica bacterium]|nr:DUF362 domain-containing protein [Candidatus Omnitrophota bacterium]
MPKVALARCEDYDLDNVYNAVKKSIDLLGGIEKFVRPGMNVLLKPNLLTAKAPEDAVITHPEVVRAVGRLVQKAGGVVWVGDAPGGYGKNIDEIFEKSGLRHIASEEDFELVKFTTANFVDGIPIAKQVFDADFMISIPKLKTHCVTVMTAAIKNTFGTVTGLYKAECHSRAPRERELAEILVKVHSISKPGLTVIDGIVGMEGDGPSGGSPKAMSVVMAGEDAVAIDSCIAKMIGLNPLDIEVTKKAYEAGLGEADLSKIEIAGDSLEGFIVKNFKLPQTMPLNIIPRPILKWLLSMVGFKPVIDEGVCVRCGLCKTACPTDCINIEEHACGIDYKKCVRCLCCHEVCPYKAISIKRNLLTKLIWG